MGQREEVRHSSLFQAGWGFTVMKTLSLSEGLCPTNDYIDSIGLEENGLPLCGVSLVSTGII